MSAPRDDMYRALVRESARYHADYIERVFAGIEHRDREESMPPHAQWQPMEPAE